MALYRYALYNPERRRQLTPKPELVPKFQYESQIKFERSPDSTATVISEEEASFATSGANDNFDLSRFFDFQSHDHYQVQQSYEQYRAVNNSSPKSFPPLHQHFPMYVPAPPPMMAFPVQQPMVIPFHQSQPRTQQFHPIIYSSRDISSNMNKRKRVPRGPRSDSGCYVCRLRHLKCDENQPGCIRCGMIGIKCEYPDNKRHKPAYMVSEEAKRMKLYEIKRHTQPTN